MTLKYYTFHHVPKNKFIERTRRFVIEVKMKIHFDSLLTLSGENSIRDSSMAFPTIIFHAADSLSEFTVTRV